MPYLRYRVLLLPEEEELFSVQEMRHEVQSRLGKRRVHRDTGGRIMKRRSRKELEQMIQSYNRDLLWSVNMYEEESLIDPESNSSKVHGDIANVLRIAQEQLVRYFRPLV